MIAAGYVMMEGVSECLNGIDRFNAWLYMCRRTVAIHNRSSATDVREQFQECSFQLDTRHAGMGRLAQSTAGTSASYKSSDLCFEVLHHDQYILTQIRVLLCHR